MTTLNESDLRDKLYETNILLNFIECVFYAYDRGTDPLSYLNSAKTDLARDREQLCENLNSYYVLRALINKSEQEKHDKMRKKLMKELGELE